ncbi:MAG: phospholipid-binding protein MlaC [Paracoccaceae bacterium]
MANDIDRRGVLTLSLGAILAAAAGRPALALQTGVAEGLIDRLVADINGIINSGRTEGQMFGDFERLFNKYADVSLISQFALSRRITSVISSGELRAFEQAFVGYIARKYGRRFREFIGGRVEVNRSQQLREDTVMVTTTAILRGVDPFRVDFQVSDRGGKPLFVDMKVEGISLLRSEQQEIQAMYDQAGRSIAGLIARVKQAG